jgi:hypothetical protein
VVAIVGPLMKVAAAGVFSWSVPAAAYHNIVGCRMIDIGGLLNRVLDELSLVSLKITELEAQLTVETARRADAERQLASKIARESDARDSLENVIAQYQTDCTSELLHRVNGVETALRHRPAIAVGIRVVGFDGGDIR